MPIEFQTSLDLDLVYTRWSGSVTIDDFRRTWATYLNDAYYKPGRTELNDFTDVEKVDADFSSIWSALNMVNAQMPGQIVRTRTLLVAPDDVVFGLTRIYQTLSENSEGIVVELYRSREEALAALDLGVDTLAALFEEGNFLPHAPIGKAGNGD